MFADIEFDRVDVERQSVLESFEAIFEVFSGSATVADNVKIVTKTQHIQSHTVVVGSETGTLNYTRDVDLQK
jgi:hypothetical protein